jgi:hypothetical protein
VILLAGTNLVTTPFHGVRILLKQRLIPEGGDGDAPRLSARGFSGLRQNRYLCARMQLHNSSGRDAVDEDRLILNRHFG